MNWIKDFYWYSELYGKNVTPFFGLNDWNVALCLRVAADAMAMGKLHKDVAQVIVQSAEDAERSDSQVIKVRTGTEPLPSPPLFRSEHQTLIIRTFPSRQRKSSPTCSPWLTPAKTLSSRWRFWSSITSPRPPRTSCFTWQLQSNSYGYKLELVPRRLGHFLSPQRPFFSLHWNLKVRNLRFQVVDN